MYKVIDKYDSRKIINVTTVSDIHDFTDNIEEKPSQNQVLNTFQQKNAIYMGKSALYMHKIIDKYESRKIINITKIFQSI